MNSKMEEIYKAQILVRDEQIANLKKNRPPEFCEYTGVTQNCRLEFEEGHIIWNGEYYDLWSILEAHFDKIEARRSESNGNES